MIKETLALSWTASIYVVHVRHVERVVGSPLVEKVVELHPVCPSSPSSVRTKVLNSMTTKNFLSV